MVNPFVKVVFKDAIALFLCPNLFRVSDILAFFIWFYNNYYDFMMLVSVYLVFFSSLFVISTSIKERAMTIILTPFLSKCFNKRSLFIERRWCIKNTLILINIISSFNDYLLFCQPNIKHFVLKIFVVWLLSLFFILIHIQYTFFMLFQLIYTHVEKIFWVKTDKLYFLTICQRLLNLLLPLTILFNLHSTFLSLQLSNRLDCCFMRNNSIYNLVYRLTSISSICLFSTCWYSFIIFYRVSWWKNREFSAIWLEEVVKHHFVWDSLNIPVYYTGMSLHLWRIYISSILS